jgi:glyoxylase-like metal-dependent hydrolase (beta-lactamase superfamily II)
MTAAILFRQLFDQSSGTYSYLLADSQSRQALLIDSVYEQYQRDLSLVRELELTLLTCIETHCHADHVTGAWLMQQALGSQIMASSKSGIAPMALN